MGIVPHMTDGFKIDCAHNGGKPCAVCAFYIVYVTKVRQKRAFYKFARADMSWRERATLLLGLVQEVLEDPELERYIADGCLNDEIVRVHLGDLIVELFSDPGKAAS